ncbi:hypothetical protein EMIT0373P_30870 [Pseudomonas chlororaphis]
MRHPPCDNMSHFYRTSDCPISRPFRTLSYTQKSPGPEHRDRGFLRRVRRFGDGYE